MSYTGGVQNRRKRAIERLEAQLKSNTKNVAEFSGNLASWVDRPYPLEEKDIKRIKKEIETLKSRI